MILVVAMKFLVSGKIPGRKFSKEVEAQSEKRAREVAYSLLGSHQGLARSSISIESVTKVV